MTQESRSQQIVLLVIASVGIEIVTTASHQYLRLVVDLMGATYASSRAGTLRKDGASLLSSMSRALGRVDWRGGGGDLFSTSL